MLQCCSCTQLLSGCQVWSFQPQKPQSKVWVTRLVEDLKINGDVAIDESENSPCLRQRCIRQTKNSYIGDNLSISPAPQCCLLFACLSLWKMSVACDCINIQKLSLVLNRILKSCMHQSFQIKWPLALQSSSLVPQERSCAHKCTVTSGSASSQKIDMTSSRLDDWGWSLILNHTLPSYSHHQTWDLGMGVCRVWDHRTSIKASTIVTKFGLYLIVCNGIFKHLLGTSLDLKYFSQHSCTPRQVFQEKTRSSLPPEMPTSMMPRSMSRPKHKTPVAMQWIKSIETKPALIKLANIPTQRKESWVQPICRYGFLYSFQLEIQTSSHLPLPGPACSVGGTWCHAAPCPVMTTGGRDIKNVQPWRDWKRWKCSKQFFGGYTYMQTLGKLYSKICRNHTEKPTCWYTSLRSICGFEIRKQHMVNIFTSDSCVSFYKFSSS